MAKRIDLRHTAITEKEEGKYRATKGVLMLITGIILLMVAWLVFPQFDVSIVPLYAITAILTICCTASIWLIFNGLYDVKKAKRYLLEWEA